MRARTVVSVAMVLMVAASAGSVHGAAGDGGIVQGVIDFPENHYFPGIPDIRVFVRDAATLAESIRVSTDSRGNFVLPNQPAGDYHLCWEERDGLAAGCGVTETSDDPDPARTFDVLDNVSVRWIAGRVSVKPEAIAIRGLVSQPGGAPAPTFDLPDNTTCRHSDPFFGVDVTPMVRLFDDTGEVASVRASTLGEYLLAFVPGSSSPTEYHLTVACDGAETSVPLGVLPGPGTYPQDVTLPANEPPTIASLQAFVGPQAVQAVPPGTKVQVSVTANDADANELHYRWQATAGKVSSTDTPTVTWTLPQKGRGLHFLYVLVSDERGGYRSQRVAVSTDPATIVPAPPGGPAAPPAPADFLPESDRFLAFRGIDSRRSACEYYRVLKAVNGCDADGTPHGGLTFKRWKARNGFQDDRSNPPGQAGGTEARKPGTGELTAAFRNVADLNLVRDHHGRRVGPDHIAYYVCNHAQNEGDNLPEYNLVACVAMEYSVIRGVNDDRPFTQFYTFGPAGDLYLSVNLDGRGEKFMPGTCVPCHGGDGYFDHFPEQGAGARDANIGAYFEPFDLDNYAFAPLPGFTRGDQEDAIRELNLLLKETDPTPAMVQVIDGWYPGGQGTQQSEFLPPGWDPALDPTLPTVTNGAAFDADALYLQVIKPACRLCHLTMGTKLGLDFNRYEALADDDPTTPPDDRGGDFLDGFSDRFGEFNEMGKNNDLHTYETVCSEQFEDGLTTYNYFDDTNQPAHTMPNAVVTFNRFWSDPAAVDLLRQALGTDAASCPGPPF